MAIATMTSITTAMPIARGNVEAVVGMAMVTPWNSLRCHLFSGSTEQRLQKLCGNPIARTHDQVRSTDRKRLVVHPF
jgi:hypothetical protein